MEVDSYSLKMICIAIQEKIRNVFTSKVQYLQTIII